MREARAVIEGVYTGRRESGEREDVETEFEGEEGEEGKCSEVGGAGESGKGKGEGVQDLSEETHSLGLMGFRCAIFGESGSERVEKGWRTHIARQVYEKAV